MVYTVKGGRNLNSFGAMLKQNRKLAGFTQERLAEELKVSTIAVQNWESGKNQIRLEKLSKLSELFNIPLEKLIYEMLISEENDLPDRFPYFLFDEETNTIVRTLHLTMSQQELFGILYIYHAEFLDRKEMDSENLREDLKRIPYQFISQFGSINLLNIAEGLYHVLKYVQTDFLIKVLRLNPEKEFNLCRLSMEQICDFIDYGHKKLDEADWNADSDHALWFHVNMHKAKQLLPELKKKPVHLTNGHWSNPLCDDVPLWLICTDNVPEYLQCRRNEIPEWYGNAEKFTEEWDRYHNPARIRSGIEKLVNYIENEQAEWILSINEQGEKLLNWLQQNES